MASLPAAAEAQPAVTDEQKADVARLELHLQALPAGHAVSDELLRCAVPSLRGDWETGLDVAVTLRAKAAARFFRAPGRALGKLGEAQGYEGGERGGDGR